MPAKVHVNCARSCTQHDCVSVCARDQGQRPCHQVIMLLPVHLLPVVCTMHCGTCSKTHLKCRQQSTIEVHSCLDVHHVKSKTVVLI